METEILTDEEITELERKYAVFISGDPTPRPQVDKLAGEAPWDLARALVSLREARGLPAPSARRFAGPGPDREGPGDESAQDEGIDIDHDAAGGENGDEDGQGEDEGTEDVGGEDVAKAGENARQESLLSDPRALVS